MKSKFKKTLSFFLCVCILFTGCGVKELGDGTLNPLSSNQSADFDAVLEQWFTKQISQDVLSCHFSIQDPLSYGISIEDNAFSDYTYTSFEESQKQTHSFIKELKSISYKDLSHRQQLLYDILYDYYSLQCDYDDYYYYADPLSPSNGVPVTLPVLLSAYSFNNKQDIQQYFSLLDHVDIYFQQLFLFAKEKNNKELLGDTYCLKQTASFCKDFSSFSQTHLLLSSFQERIASCSFLSASEKQKYITKNHHLICDVVLPSYLSLSDRLLSLSVDEPSDLCLCHRSDGHRYYATLVKSATGCKDSPYRLFQRIAKKREEDMQQLTSLFTKQPSLATTLSNYHCPLNDPEEMLDLLKSSMVNDYPSSPDLSVTVKEISPQVRKFCAPAYYLIAPIDACEEHEIYYNATAYPDSLELFTTMAHEGFPGHLYQTYLSYRSGFEPVRLLLAYPGYVEGWATYVELESYQYAGLPFSVASALSLNQSITLSLYASADIGVHYYGWTKDTLSSFLNEYGISDKETVSDIYEWIVMDPANYLKYYVGYLNFIDLKKECQEKFPDTFTAMNFHKYILQTGPCSFPVLRKELFYQFDNNA